MGVVAATRGASDSDRAGSGAYHDTVAIPLGPARPHLGQRGRVGVGREEDPR
jgi:hypothetical protein